MWKLKKIIASVIALASMVGCITTIPLNVNAATTYQKDDVNGDGLVNNTDTQWARQFLYGMAGASDGATAERLDVNQNGIIDENDVDIIRNIILKLESGGTLTSKDTTALPNQEDREYYVYDTKSGQRIDSECYTLKTSDVSSITSISSRSIIGDDDRNPEDGLKGVIKTTTGGTAFVIGSHTILTAAHCLKSDSNSNYTISEVNFKFYDDYDQVDNMIKITPLRYHMPKIYAETLNTHYDYAIVTVKEDLSQYVNFTLGTVRECVISASNPTIYVTGFGNDTRPGANTALNGKKSTGEGKIFPKYDGTLDKYKIYYTADVLPGNSGGPLFVTSISSGKINRTVIGIVRGETDNYNTAMRITTDILQFVYNNEHL